MAEAKKASKKPGQVEETLKEGVKDGANQEINQAKTIAAEESKEAVSTTKAGRRSAKALKEAEEKQAKEERKTKKAAEEESAKTKVAQKPPRSRLERRGKKFRELAKYIDQNKLYALEEALELAVKTSPTKFDATVELHIKLGVDPKQADQNVRDNIMLPSGTGKTVRVAVLAEADDAKAAKAAGADMAGHEELLANFDKETLDFDVLIATPVMMPRLGKYARLLGPKGLMPNPKSGTVTADVAKAVKEAKAGRVEYRVDSTGIVHLGIGKVSFGKEKLAQNAQAILSSIKSNKPASLKGTYIQGLYVATTMGPSISVTPSAM